VNSASAEIVYTDTINGVDWPALKQRLAEDDFDNGRTPAQLEASFANSYAIALAWRGNEIIGTARVLSDGVCNAYLIDVWTYTPFRKRGIAREMIRRLCQHLEGQHVYLQADDDIAEIYRRLGFTEQPVGMSRVIGRWLVNNPQ
jgi:predicted GNAT family acetyltransferase